MWGFGINEPVEVEPLACSSVGHAAVMQNSRVALNCSKVFGKRESDDFEDVVIQRDHNMIDILDKLQSGAHDQAKNRIKGQSDNQSPSHYSCIGDLHNTANI